MALDVTTRLRCLGHTTQKCSRYGLSTTQHSQPTTRPPTLASTLVARHPHEIVLAPEAVEDLNALKAASKAAVKDALETHLRNEPAKVSKSRIKWLRGVTRPQYRLRVDEIRVFYDVVGTEVEVLAVVAKSEAEQWLEKFATKAE